MELGVTDRNPNIDEPVDFTVRLWRFNPLCVWLPVHGAKVAVWRNDVSGASTKTDVITDPNGEATVTEAYSDPTDLTYYAEYTPPHDSPLKGSSSNTVIIRARIGTTLALQWPMDERVCEDLRCCGPLRGRLTDQYDNGIGGKEIVVTAHWYDSNNDSGVTPVTTMKSDSRGFVHQMWSHYQLTGHYELWYDRIKADFAGDDAYHGSGSEWVFGDE